MSTLPPPPHVEPGSLTPYEARGATAVFPRGSIFAYTRYGDLLIGHIWFDSNRMKIETSEMVRRMAHVENVEVARDAVWRVRIIRRPFFVALSVLLQDGTEPDLNFRVFNGVPLRKALLDRSWPLLEERTRVHHWKGIVPPDGLASPPNLG